MLIDQNDFLDKRAKYDKLDSMFGVKTQMGDLNGGLVYVKKGNGDTTDQQCLDETEDNIRDRFSLDNNNDGDADADDYNY